MFENNLIEEKMSSYLKIEEAFKNKIFPLKQLLNSNEKQNKFEAILECLKFKISKYYEPLNQRRKNLEAQKENLKVIFQEFSTNCDEDKEIIQKKIELIKNFNEIILLPQKFNNILKGINRYFASNIVKNNEGDSLDDINDIPDNDHTIKLGLEKKKLNIIVENDTKILVIDNENKRFYSIDDILSYICHKPCPICKISEKSYEESFLRLKDFIKNNRSFPLFEDVKGIMLLLRQANFFPFFETGFENCFQKNQNIFHKERKICENKKDPFYLIIVAFIEKALKYQREYFTWYTHALWFNKNSETIFECFGDKFHCEKNEQNQLIHETNEQKDEKNLSEKEIDIQKLKKQKLELGRFHNWVSPFKSLRPLLIGFCDKPIKKNAKSSVEKNFLTQEEYAEKINFLCEYISENKMFPPFTESLELQEALPILSGYFFPKSRLILPMNNYFRNIETLQRMKRKIDLSIEKNRLTFEYYEYMMDYQGKYLIFPRKALWFNSHSKEIFEHLEKWQK